MAPTLKSTGMYTVQATAVLEEGPKIWGGGDKEIKFEGIGFASESWRGALCVEMGFYLDISWESRCNIEINV